MEKLISYINALSAEDRLAFERNSGTSIAYLRKASSMKQRIGEKLCIDIERATAGEVTCEDIRPDLNDHWSYLRGTKVA